MSGQAKDAPTMSPARHGREGAAPAFARYRGLALLVIVVVVLPWLLPNDFFFNVTILIGINAIVCVGLNILVGYAGQISLGHAGFFGLGAYASAILTARLGWSPLVATPIGAVLVGLLAFLVARPILRLKGHYLAMATLGMGIIIAIVLVQEVKLTGGPDGMDVPPLRLFGADIYSGKIWYGIVAAFLVLAVWLALNLVDSPFGRALRGLHGSEVAAAAMAVDTARAKTLAFVISALFASVAGSLYAYYSGFLTPAEGQFLRSIQFVTMVVLGGMASTYGAVVGAAILTLLPQALTIFHDYEQMVLGLILMLTMIFMPKGLVPSLAALLRRRRE
ncbi:MAG TPA: branched-chain amino acid ABC transporter permease [Alphaproteobacteria bacterium]|nr:branched-chain amino acid ABC transporter permease [Alphaproteobacteria bacterium]